MSSGFLFFALAVSTFSFSHIDVEDGLSQSSVFAIEQDRKGCIWLATYDGLCRYDGYDITVFRHDESNRKSIGGNIIRQLLIDSDGYVWAATNKGFSCYDIYSGCFRNLDMGVDDLYIYNMAEYDRRHLLARSSGHTYIIDRNTLQISEDIASLSLKAKDSYFKNSRVGLVIASNDGSLDLLSESDHSRTTLLRKCPASVRSIVASRDSCLYLGSEGEGFSKLDLKNGQFKRYTLRSSRVRAMCCDSKGDIWIGTANNLFVLNPTTENIIEISPDSRYPDAISNGSIRSLFCDSSGGIWAGTFFGGANYYNPWKSHFESIRYKSPDKDIVGCISEDENNELWVGTFRDGVIKYNKDYSSYSNLRVMHSTSRDETKDVKSIVFSSKKVYVGAELGGLNIIDRYSGKTTHIKSEGIFNSVYDIIKSSQNAYWLGTNRGLYHLNPEDNSIYRVSDLGLVRRIHKSSARDLWLGGDGFLARCVETTGPEGKEEIMIIRHFENISWVQDINSCGEFIWIGTRNGLFRYSIGRDAIEKVRIINGDISVKAIEDGGNGIIWLSTENGIYCYDFSSGTSRRYGRNDGLVSTTYNIGARAKLSDGSICFGGLEGITKFKPSEIIPQTFTPNPIINRITVDGNEIETVSEDIVHIKASKGIINIRFSSPDYISWKNVSFKYMLDGFDSKWREADISRTATYSNLPKGRYKLKVISSNPDGICSSSSATLSIRVHPAWYQTTAFIVIAILSILATLSYLIINHIRSIRKDTSEQIEGLKLRLYSGPKADDELSSEDALFLKKAIKVVNENLSNEKFSADMFAKEMGLSRTGLHTRLKTVTGESALEFIKKVRFNEACELLRKGGLTVSEVGYKVGYSSPAYFATSFKKRIGKTPKDYQKITQK